MARAVLHVVAGVMAVAVLSSTAGAAIIFDNFNVDEGHFGYAPGFSSQSVGESVNSTADRFTTEGPFEGAGHQKLVLAHDGTPTNLRIRHASGAAPFGSAQAGAPGSNVPFVTSAGTDGFIGFYAKTTNTGWTIALNLDGADGAAASMDMGTPKALIGDDQWHLYEWNLDDNAQWDPVTSIGGDGTIQDEQHTVDSIYIFANQTGTTDQARPPLYLDFVAKSDSGSIAALVPEPATATLLGLVAAAGLAFRPRRRGR